MKESKRKGYKAGLLNSYRHLDNSLCPLWFVFELLIFREFPVVIIKEKVNERSHVLQERREQGS